MKAINEAFEDEEFEALKRAKAESNAKNWHDFILLKCIGSITVPQGESKT